VVRDAGILGAVPAEPMDEDLPPGERLRDIAYLHRRGAKVDAREDQQPLPGPDERGITPDRAREEPRCHRLLTRCDDGCGRRWRIHSRLFHFSPISRDTVSALLQPLTRHHVAGNTHIATSQYIKSSCREREGAASMPRTTTETHDLSIGAVVRREREKAIRPTSCLFSARMWIGPR
jgi:hypothetical protein